MIKVYDMVIIGGGASGLFLAGLLSNRGYSVAICEAENRVGKKLLMTGNGKCNMMNVDNDHTHYNTTFVHKAIEKFNCDKLRELFFSEIKLLTRVDEEGRVYPYSNSAAAVLNALIDRIGNVEILTDFPVKSITSDGKYFCVVGPSVSVYARNVCLATGSAASIGHNSHSILTKFGHKLASLRPAMLPMLTDNIDVAIMQGLRHNVTATLIVGNKPVVRKSGEMLFKKGALSGIVSFELSAVMSRLDVSSAKVSIDFMPDVDEPMVAKMLDSISLEGIFHKTIAGAIDRDSGDSNESKARSVKRFIIKVTANTDDKAAQIYCGGLSCAEFCSTTMASRIKRGLYAIGEALDVDGDSGGYNLHWAWASAAMLAEGILARDDNENNV